MAVSCLSPRTPSSLLAALVLSPTLATTCPSSIPIFSFSPPTPSPPPAPSVEHRHLAPNEARQLTLLLTQHLFPVRHSTKGLMRESIALAEKLHDAGLRWDRHRRVMGTHLRGIWEEGQRLATGRVVGGHGPMDLYVQGSFLTVADKPHPLDPMPIPLEVQPASFAALPKLTLQSGLANALPGAPTCFDDAPLVTAINRTDIERKIVKRKDKKPGLRIRTDGPLQPRMRLSTPHIVADGEGVGKWPRFGTRKGKGKSRGEGGVRGEVQTARRVSFRGWELR